MTLLKFLQTISNEVFLSKLICFVEINLYQMWFFGGFFSKKNHIDDV